MDHGMTSPYDPKDFAPASGVVETAAVEVLKAEATIDSKAYIVLKSAFGSIYVPKELGLTLKGLAEAVCTNKLPAPGVSGEDKPLQGDEATLAPAVIKSIESHCK